jgi:hypothetical protein
VLWVADFGDVGGGFFLDLWFFVYDESISSADSVDFVDIVCRRTVSEW